jgi:proline iminopeptidase
MQRIANIASALIAVLILGAAAAAQQKPEPRAFSRSEAQGIVREARRITTPQGIEELQAVEIGGIKQWISVRGRDRRNPILLFIHGGAGESEMPSSWLYQSSWEDYFTVVQWDQRGAGKTGRASELQKMALTMNIPRMVSDGEEMVEYLRKTYGRRKIFVLGHSWGSVIGLSIARDHPEWLYAYIGMGQMINWTDNERASYAWTLSQARAKGDQKAIKELLSIAPYPELDGSTISWKTILERKWAIHFGSLAWGRSDFSYLQNALKLSPEYTDSDLAVRDEQARIAGKYLYFGPVNFDGLTKVACPVYILMGRYDHQTPGEVAFRWFSKLDAPKKQFVWFEDASHELQTEAPGKLLVFLATDVRPIAAAAGDVPPKEQDASH